MEQTDILEAQANLARLIEQARNGEEVIIASAGHPLVRLVPIQTPGGRRVGGQWRGQVRIAPDFDELPEDFAADFGPSQP